MLRLRRQQTKTRGEPVSLLTYGIVYKEEFSRPSNTYVASNPLAEDAEAEDDTEVQSIHLKMVEEDESSNQSSSGASDADDDEDEGVKSEELITVF